MNKLSVLLLNKPKPGCFPEIFSEKYKYLSSVEFLIFIQWNQEKVHFLTFTKYINSDEFHPFK